MRLFGRKAIHKHKFHDQIVRMHEHYACYVRRCACGEQDGDPFIVAVSQPITVVVDCHDAECNAAHSWRTRMFLGSTDVDVQWPEKQRTP